MKRPISVKKSGTSGELVGDAGFEPATSTMSTWRSTPELIALLLPRALNQHSGPVWEDA